MKSVLIIGVGNLGRRHLQSVIETCPDVLVYVYDTNADTVGELKELYDRVIFLESLSSLPDHVSLAIIATSASVRRHVFEEMIEACDIDYVIFEKVLFQCVEDYHFVGDQIIKRGIGAWVNCARREWRSYQSLKSELQGAKEFLFTTSGSQWGMACNSIHILDLIEYLSGDKINSIDISGVCDVFFESKRKGYYEFDGRISGRTERQYGFSISCFERAGVPVVHNIVTDVGQYMIMESQNRVLKASPSNNWEWIEEDFRMEYQSEMTGRIVNSIFDKGVCELPDYHESMRLHLLYINALIPFFERKGFGRGLCPIT